MDCRTAERLARRIEREDPRISVTGFRRWQTRFRNWEPLNRRRATYSLDCTDNRSGYTFVIGSPEDWDERKKEGTDG